MNKTIVIIVSVLFIFISMFVSFYFFKINQKSEFINLNVTASKDQIWLQLYELESEERMLAGDLIEEGDAPKKFENLERKKYLLHASSHNEDYCIYTEIIDLGKWSQEDTSHYVEIIKEAYCIDG